MILRTVFKRERETDKTSIQPGSQPDSADQFAECERVGSPPPQTVLSRRDSSQSAFKKKKNPAASLSLSINQHSPSFSPLVLLSPTYSSHLVCAFVIEVDTVVSACVSVCFGEGGWSKSVCPRHQWHGEEMSAAVSLNLNFSPLTGGWLKWQAASVTSERAHKQHLFMFKRQSPLAAVENRILVNTGDHCP